MSRDPFYNSVVPSRVPASLVHDFNIYDYQGRDPFEVMGEMHHAGLPDLFWTRNNGGHWIALGAKVITEVAMDPVRFSGVRPIVPDSENLAEPIMIPLFSDPPLHTGYRSVLAPLFAPKHIASLDKSLREYADEVALTIKRRGECEFMADVANEMPIVVFLRFLALPIEDRFRLQDLASAFVRPEDGSHRDKPMENLLNYLRPIIEQRFANPGIDIISQIVTRTIDGKPLEPNVMLNLTMSTLLGGLETVTSVLGYATHYLAEHPEARGYLRENPAAIPNAVEEFLRRFPPAQSGRIARDDFKFRDVEMRKGDHVNWSTGMFNLDHREVDDPLRVDFNRKRPPHMTFGMGAHFCLGAFLARLEITVFLEHWLKHVPNFRVNPDATLHHRTGLTMAYKALPLIIDPD